MTDSKNIFPNPSSSTDKNVASLLALTHSGPSGGSFSFANVPTGLISMTSASYTFNYQIVASNVASASNITITIQKSCPTLGAPDSFNFPGSNPTSNTYTLNYPGDFSGGSSNISISVANFGYVDTCIYTHTVSASNNSALPVGTNLGSVTLSYFDSG
ncbi:hypothetical protein [Leptospira fletcheri]|nr:hypothetical protein [Leptospira fletcheri]